MIEKKTANQTFKTTEGTKTKLKKIGKALDRTPSYLCHKYVSDGLARDEKKIGRRKV